MIILSVDSGLEKTGFALFEKKRSIPNGFKYIYSDLIITSKTESNPNRLLSIYRKFVAIIKRFSPDIVLLEQLFFFKNAKTAMSIAQTQGVVILAAAEKKIPIEFLAPLQIKQIVTGYGLADKKSVQKMLKMTLHLDGEIKSDDVADAVACGLAYCYLKRN